MLEKQKIIRYYLFNCKMFYESLLKTFLFKRGFLMKKLFSVLAVLFVLGTVNVFALGIGPQGGYTVNGSPSGALTFKVDSLPCVFAVSAELGKVTAVGVTADWWIANPKIEGTWGYFYGLGLAGSFVVTSDVGGMFFGGRALVGTNIFLLDGHRRSSTWPACHLRGR